MRDKRYWKYGERKAVLKRIREASKLAGVSRRTLQYYDDMGILGIERSEVNYRLYSEESMQRLWEILIYKESGMKLKSIRKLLELSENDKTTYLQEYIVGLKCEIGKLQEQIRFSVWLLEYGMPEKPQENGERNYVEEIEMLKEVIREE